MENKKKEKGKKGEKEKEGYEEEIDSFREG